MAKRFTRICTIYWDDLVGEAKFNWSNDANSLDCIDHLDLCDDVEHEFNLYREKGHISLAKWHNEQVQKTYKIRQ